MFGGPVAPPAMAQVWTMRGLNGRRTADDPLGRASELFDEAGYTSVVATNCDTTYHRYLDVGEQVSLSAELLDVIGPKQTALGEGWFFTTRNTWSVGDEVVGPAGPTTATRMDKFTRQILDHILLGDNNTQLPSEAPLPPGVEGD